MMLQADQIRPAIFLDTNALHFLRTYLDLAKKHGFRPYGSIEEWSAISDQLKAASLLLNQRDSIKNGFDTFCFLQKKAGEDDRIIVSRLALAEITHGLVEGQAHFRMAEAGMPFRMRQSWSDLKRMLAAWMSSSGFEQVRMATEGLIPELENILNIQIWRAGGDSSDREVLTLLESVLKWVYFDVIDAWLYAESLFEQVHLFLTFDRAFRDTINWIHNPGSAPHNDENDLWKQARSAIQSATASVLLLSTGEENRVIIPQGIDPRKTD